MPCISGLRNKSNDNFRERLIQKQDIQKYYHDRGSKSIKPFIENQDINVYNQNTKTWDKSKVVDINLDKYRTYKVETDHGTLVRNRFHLKPSKQSSLGSSSSDHFQTTDRHINDDDVNKYPEPEPSADGYVTKSGRLSKPPERLVIS
ncbi:hypothetical protein SNE40_014379 [Patella caerulea]|uniref:Uncharacterized protein n=1 Tax=Patella caerulea TaxID=87958 RepID=A0AAN8JDD6_PATCE